MSSSEFAFVPRKLAKHGRTTSNASGSRTSTLQKQIQTDQGVSKKTSGYEKKEGKYLNDNDYTALFELALSEHALWSNTELLEIMEANEDGFVPISYLIQTSPVFAGLSTLPPEVTLIRCVRASSTLEGRLMVLEFPSGDWYRRALSMDIENQGGFEVRCKDWPDVIGRIRKYTSYHWDSRTIYVENLPYRARTFHAVYEFVRELLADGSSPERNTSLIQSVSFPPHQKDGPDIPPPAVGKGFAFAVLSHAKDVDRLLHRWSWDLDERPDQDTHGQASKTIREAIELGFRCLSKRKWDELRGEYLSLQHRLLEKVMASNLPGPSVNKPPRFNTISAVTPRMEEGESTSSNIERNGSAWSSQCPAWFPADCLVFIKNVHSGTNKTTLRVLFASAFDKDTSPIDYVDYTKGLDRCYLRLSNSQHARMLVSYFSKHKIAQADSLDSVGALEPGSLPIEVELVQGKREEMYWEKVPEKIRKAAIASAQGKSGINVSVQEQNRDGDGRRKRKRRKRD